jgi:hypothetical protein
MSVIATTSRGPAPTLDADALEAYLADRRRQWFRQWSAKALARELGCEVRTAVGYRNGNRPAPQQVETMVRCWGRSILDVLYGPLMEAPDLSITDRLARVLRETAQIKQELEALNDRLHEMPPASRTLPPGQSDRAAAADGVADPGGSGVGTELAVDGPDPAGTLDRREGLERRSVGRRVSDLARVTGRAITCLLLLVVILGGQVSGTFDAADLDLRRGPSGRIQTRSASTRTIGGRTTGARAMGGRTVARRADSPGSVA